MGSMKTIALLIDEYREEAQMDLGAMKLLSTSIDELGDLDPTDTEKNALMHAIRRSIDALEAQAMSKVSSCRYWIKVLNRMGMEATDLAELLDVIDTLDPSKGGEKDEA